ncbi:MAG TPA: 2-oxoglutarate dehydrogenase E1 component, partial [Candidatus Limnocylindria bacterium]|nr:2-oxoglutarate dehydrogenase E1 component [Candidatus Limnocylindria bacterium]
MSKISLGNPSLTNVAFVEELYGRYLQDPASVAEEWQGYFSNGEFADDSSSKTKLTSSLAVPGLFAVSAGASDVRTASALQDKVDQLVRAYRFRGHMAAQLDPLGQPRTVPPELNPEFYGLSSSDMAREFSVEGVGPKEKPVMTLRETLENLRNTYCRSIGVEFMHIADLSIRRWLQERMETTENRFQIPRDVQLRILTRLTDAVIFEEFIRKKFIGAKSFSLEGSESLIPLLDLVIEKAASQGVREIDMGMAHRGRLNVLANIFGKHPKMIFREFADTEP